MSPKRRPSDAATARGPQPDYVRGWVDFAVLHAVEDPALQRAGRVSPDHFDFMKEHVADAHAEALGLLVQLACERPDEFRRVFAPLFFPEMPAEDMNPFTERGLGFIRQIYANGIMDDWEIFLRWTDDGYVVVNEGDRRDSDVRFNWKIASGHLFRLADGRREAPGEADVEALVQHQMTLPSSVFKV